MHTAASGPLLAKQEAQRTTPATCRAGWMSRWKLGSMNRKWVISPTYEWGIYWGYNPLTNLLLTFRDIQVVVLDPRKLTNVP